MDGFTYNGYDSKLLHVYVNPGPSERWFESPGFESKSVEGTWRNGGYFYGMRVKTRTISISCWFEDITQRQREKIRWWLNRDTEGDLIFDERPFVKYKVRPGAITNGKIYATQYNNRREMLYSGTFTVSFTAYDPFGYLTYTSYTAYDELGASRYCNMLKTSEMPSLPTTSSRSFLIYNPGTERSAVTFTIGGSAANGLTITNQANGTACVLESLPSTGSLTIDSDSGLITNGTAYAFEYHDHGYVSLEPCHEMIDDIVARYTSGSTSVTLGGYYGDASGLVGKYMLIDGNWIRISAGSGSTITLETAPSSTDTNTTKIAEMNRITITGDGITLNALSYSFEPRIL